MFDEALALVEDALDEMGAAHLLDGDALRLIGKLDVPEALRDALGKDLLPGTSVARFLRALADAPLATVLDSAAQNTIVDALIHQLAVFSAEPEPKLTFPLMVVEKKSLPKDELLDEPLLIDLLDRSAVEVGGWDSFSLLGPRATVRMSVREFLGDSREVARRTQANHARVPLAQDRLRTKLQQALKNGKRNQEREQAFLQHLQRWPDAFAVEDIAVLNELQTMLLQARAELRARAPVSIRDEATVDFVRTDHPPRLSLAQDYRYIRLDLLGGARLRQGPGCPPHLAVAFIDVILRAMRTEALGPWLAAMLQRPAWAQLVAALDELSKSEAQERKSILSWRLDLSEEVITRVTIYVHKVGKRGVSAGAATEPHRLEAGKVDLLAQDQRALREHDLSEILQALIGHPRVFFSDDPATPVNVHAAHFGVRLASGNGAFFVEAALDGLPFPPGAGSNVGNEVVWLPLRARREVLVAPVSSREKRLLNTLEFYEGVPLGEDARAPLLETLQRLETRLPVAMPEELRGDAMRSESKPFLRLHAREATFSIDVCVRPLPGGLAFPPGLGPRETSAVKDGVRVHTVRDFEEERRLGLQLQESLGLEEGERPFHSEVHEEQRMLGLLAGVRERPEVVVEWMESSRAIRSPVVVGADKLKVQVREGGHWFTLEGGLAVDDTTLQLARVLDAARQGHRFVRLHNQRFVELEETLRERLQTLDAHTRKSRDSLEIGVPAIVAAEGLQELGAVVDAPKRWTDLRARLQQAQDETPSVPSTLAAELRPYQVAGFEWMMRFSQVGIGACLADDMGLGKTVQSLAVIIARSTLGPTLAVAPTSLCFNWRNEAERFAPTLRVIDYERGPLVAGAGDLVICTYGAVTRNIEHLGETRFATVIFDEAQALKNTGTLRTRAAAKLQADWMLALTGTPVENRLGDLWSLFHVLSPGLFGSLEQFRDRFVIPIERDKDPQRRQALSRLCRPFILRRTKASVVPELPPKTEINLTVVMSDDERLMYEQARIVAQETFAKAGASEQARFAMLATLTRLRLLACHPRLYDPTSTVPSSKLAASLRLIEELIGNRHRALVFSQFVKHLDIVRAALDAQGIGYQYLDGSTPRPKREEAVAAFQRGEGALFLVSVQAGGVGLNLTAADYVIHLDPWWNPAVEDQATGRAHRIGQDKAVTVYRLFTKDTVEEKILALHGDKRDLAAAVLGGGGATMSALDVDALMALALG